GRLTAAVRNARRAPVDDHTHTPRLAAPPQACNCSVLEQALWLRNSPQVMLKEAQVEITKHTVLRTRLDVAAQCRQVTVPIDFVLGIELDHPRLFVEFIEAVLQGILQRI